jgi:uncharacterized protein (DUF2141 family)
MTAVLLVVAALAAQAPARDGAAAAAGTASIAGTVVTDTQPARPVRRAIVTVNSSDRSVGHTAVTDDSGRFLVADLPAGRFTVSVSKRGWVATSYGAKAIGRPGSAVALTDGQRARIQIPLARGAVITGTIVDQHGLPASGMFVAVMRYAYTFNTGERRLTAASATSWGPDERGTYRIWGLAPGDYFVIANGAPGFLAAGRDLHLTSDVDVQQAARAIQDGPSAPTADVPQRTVGMAPVYYPGTSSVAQATPITVRAGEERVGIDFTVQYVRSARLEGTLTAPDGSVPAGTLVTLISGDPAAGAVGFMGVRTARTDTAGKFTFAEVTPGLYTIATRATITAAGPAPRVLWASTEVDVTGEDLPSLPLSLQESLTVSGTVRLDGASPPLPWSAMRVSLTPQQTGTSIIVTGSGTGGNIDAEGRFTLTGVTPGRYRLTATTMSPQSAWVARSSAVGGHEALDVPIDIRQSTADAVVTFTDRAAELSGRILTAAGAAPDHSVVLFSSNRAHWFAQSRRVLAMRAASDGTYTFRNVPPGEYQIAAVDDVEQGEWYDPTFLQRLALSATPIAIAEGEKKVQDIRAGGG